eukprot:9487176-Pyramimonas_sp.AAC.2
MRKREEHQEGRGREGRKGERRSRDEVKEDGWRREEGGANIDEQAEETEGPQGWQRFAHDRRGFSIVEAARRGQRSSRQW